MLLHDLKLKSLTSILKHTPSESQWYTKSRKTHIIGIQLYGNMYHEIAGKTIILTEGSVFFFNQRDDFHAVVRELGESYTVHFTTYEPIDAESFAVKSNNPAVAISLLERMEQACTPQSMNTPLSLSYFYRFCHLLETLYTQCYHPIDDRIKKSKAHLDLYFKETNVLEDAAMLSGLSRRRFNDLFKIQYGTTPNRYLTAYRISIAKKLIVGNDQPVKKAAEMSGFENYYYFSKVFKEYTGMTPSQFRKNHI